MAAIISEPRYDNDLTTKAYVDGLIDSVDTSLDETNTEVFARSKNFGAEPIPPYYLNDTYMNGTDIYICTTQRLIGSFNAADWSKASAYTDDTLASTKNKVFNTTPTTPYRIGDLWTEGPNGELRRCVVTRLTGSYNAADWENATVYDSTETIVEGGLVTTGTIQVVQGGTVAAGMTGNDSGDTAIRFWAGSTLANKATAPFQITQAGALTASNANITGTVTATTGTIGGFTLGATSLTAEKVGMSTGTVAFYSGSNTSTSAPFRVTNAGALTATNATINGTITSSTISGSSITCGSRIYLRSSGGIDNVGYFKYSEPDAGYLTCGEITTNPYVSALNVGYNGAGGGISFRSGATVSSIGSELAHIRVETTGGALYIESDGTINLNPDETSSTHDVGIMQLRLSNNTITSKASGASMQLTNNCIFWPASGGYACVGGTAASNRITVASGSSPSSLSVKQNIEKLNYDKIYNEFKQTDMYKFKYRYKKLSERKVDYGFIIDELEKLPLISKIILNYNKKGYIHDNQIISKQKNKRDKKINYKLWNRDSYIKLLFILNKSLQTKIDSLEDRLEKLEKEVKNG